MGKLAEPRLTAKNKRAIWKFFGKSRQAKQDIVQKFVNILLQGPNKPIAPEKIFSRMISLKGRGGAAEYKMEAFWKATGLSLEDFEIRVLDQENFFRLTYKSTESISDYPTAKASHTASRLEKEQFVEFFGMGVLNRPIQLMLPTRIFRDQRNEASYPNEKNCTDLREYRSVDYTRAALHMANLMVRMTGNSIDMGEMFSYEEACSLHLYESFRTTIKSLEGYFSPEFFSANVEKESSPQTSHEMSIENLNFQCGTDKNMCLKQLQKRKAMDIALIARVIPTGTSQPFFICSGSSAMGACVASYQLCKSWKSIYDYYKQQKKSLSKESFAAIIEHDVPYDCLGGIIDRAVQPNQAEGSSRQYCWVDTDNIPAIAWGTYMNPDTVWSYDYKKEDVYRA